MAVCDPQTWTGRRDHALLALQTGLRISEVAALTRADVTLTAGAHIHTRGKGRKERRTPLIPTTRAVLKAWLAELGSDTCEPLFPSATGTHLSRDAIEHRLTRHLDTAARSCPSLQAKTVTMHKLRHTAAMRLLLAGNDITVIALWLGHEQVSTTTIYLHTEMTHKQQAIDRTTPLTATAGRYKPPDPLLTFLDNL
ncbi:tyrosine-type recombinase/integrase [Aeromicrobium sp.]|uniref:tyrosine-type recombinase/integrase n=1 Tax=Aeromicrobium sp. TaxID=1871063 RepID=UPI0025C4250B|nr:tyrosine-type recombinase/integrase [Aeromicrobium sp.]